MPSETATPPVRTLADVLDPPAGKTEVVGPYMARKSVDVPSDRTDVPFVLTEAVREVAVSLFKNTQSDYGAGIPSKDVRKWDMFWAREHAAFLSFLVKGKGTSYEEYLPGRYYTYIRIADAIQEHAGELAGKRIVDVGGGSGIGLVIAAGKDAVVFNVDHSAGALNYFRYLARHYGVPDKRISTRRTDFYSTSYPDNEFDVAYNVGVVEHLSDEEQRKLVEEMWRITSPGGLVLIATPNNKSPLYQATHRRERKVFGKQGYTRYMYLLPDWAESRDVDMERLVAGAGLEVIASDGVLLFPSSKEFYNGLKDPELIGFYGSLPKVTPKGEGIDFTRNLMAYCRVMEQNLASQETRLRKGWFKYVVARKPTQ